MEIFNVYSFEHIAGAKNITQKTKDRATGTPLKTGDELLCSGRKGSSCSTYVTGRVTLVANPVILQG
jgi:hypothetical protein